jgi:hydroxyquinol 1,2-dioxygenase
MSQAASESVARATTGDDQPMTAAELTEAVVARFSVAPDPRLRQVMQSLTRHLHAFAVDVRLTQAEWLAAVQFLTATGHKCDGKRQEFILLSDTLGFSTLVDLMEHEVDGSATESTVLGPFYVPGSPERALGDSIAERPSGDPALVAGQVLDTEGRPIAGAEVDVWQNGDDMLYAVQDPEAPQTNLRGVFRTGDDGRYAFLGVRPTDYPIPDDGPVGAMLEATGRHPWRAAHLHFIVRAPGFRPVTTHVFDDGSRYLDSDTVFGVKPSLVRHFRRHEPAAGDRPLGVGADQVWYSLTFDFVLRQASSPARPAR